MRYRYRPRVVCHQYGGTPLRVHLADPLAEGWYDHDWPVLPDVEGLLQHDLGPGCCVFDLGAHQGVVALMLAHIVGPSGRVIAVEANPHNVTQAKRNRDLNGASWLTVTHAAVADRPGTLNV
jgi:hypothetical protein